MQRSLAILSTTILCAIAIAAEPEPAHDIEITASVPQVSITPQRPGRVTMRLPSLTYALILTTRCANDWKPVSVSINVADSTKSFGADDLQVGETLSFNLQIPSNQIGPLTLEQFCVRSERPEVSSTLMIPSVLSAHASLRCATKTGESITYMTVPLDVLLECVDSPSSND